MRSLVRASPSTCGATVARSRSTRPFRKPGSSGNRPVSRSNRPRPSPPPERSRGGGVRAGQRVLINGAGGAVGTFAVQLAKAYGANVTGVDATGKLDALRSIGADRVIDHTREDFPPTGERYDVIIDLPGNHPWSDLRRALTPEGAYVLIGHDQYGGAGHRWFGSLGRFGKLLVISPFVNQLHPFRGAKDPGDRLVVLKEFIEDGKLTPVIDRTFQLSEVPEAIRYLESGQAVGKVVITVGDRRNGRSRGGSSCT